MALPPKKGKKIATDPELCLDSGVSSNKEAIDFPQLFHKFGEYFSILNCWCGWPRVIELQEWAGRGEFRS